MKDRNSGVDFIQSFGLSKTDCVSVVGSGGKSSLIKRLACEAHRRGWKTVVTTTTHIHLPFLKEGEEMLLTRGPLFAEKIDERASFCPPLILVKEKKNDRKAKGFSPDELGPLVGHFFLLIEADGSKKKPFKVPNDTEPVVHPETTHTVIVTALDALGCPLREEWVHRLALLPDALREEKITPALVAEVLCEPSHYFHKIPPQSDIFFYFAGCNESNRGHLQELVSCIRHKGILFEIFAGETGEIPWIERISS